MVKISLSDGKNLYDTIFGTTNYWFPSLHCSGFPVIYHCTHQVTHKISASVEQISLQVVKILIIFHLPVFFDAYFKIYRSCSDIFALMKFYDRL